MFFIHILNNEKVGVCIWVLWCNFYFISFSKRTSKLFRNVLDAVCKNSLLQNKCLEFLCLEWLEIYTVLKAKCLVLPYTACWKLFKFWFWKYVQTSLFEKLLNSRNGLENTIKLFSIYFRTWNMIRTFLECFQKCSTQLA